MDSVRLSEVIAPGFYEVHHAVKSGKYTRYWLKGGRGSTKSSFISVEIILGMMQHSDANAVCIRKIGQYLKDSVYEQLVWAIDKLGVSAKWQSKLSPLELIYRPTGQRILFRGADKPRKLKSTKVSKGYIRYLWYEECDEFNGIEEMRTINQSLMRGGTKFDVFHSYNPPKSVRSWVNEQQLGPQEEGTLWHHSTYLNVPAEWLGERFIQDAAHLQQTKPEQYQHQYLGEVVGTGGEVFANITIRPITDVEISQFDNHRRGLDWGYAADPFVYLVMHYDKKRKRLYLFHEYYKVGAKFDAIAREIKAENKLNQRIIAESAEPRSNDELKDRGIHITAAKKGPGSIEHGITWLQNLEEIIIDNTRCPNAAREFSSYELEKDSAGNWKDGFPDKENHTIDAARYACERDMAKGGVSVWK